MTLTITQTAGIAMLLQTWFVDFFLSTLLLFCSECQEVQEVARNQPKVAVELPDQAGMEEEVDAIPSLLERHVRTDKKEETLHLEDQVLDLAKQRLGEGQYESASKFAKLVDKVCFSYQTTLRRVGYLPFFVVQKLRLPESAHKILSATKVEPLLQTMRARNKFQSIFKLEKSLAKLHRDTMMTLRPVLKVTR